MKGMQSAKEYYVPPPPGRYLAKIVEATAEFSSKGNTMLRLGVEIRQPEQYAGHRCDDYVITDGAAGGGGLGKQKLRGLGIDVDSTDAEIPDSVIASKILGLELFVEFDNEDKMTEGVKGSGKYDKPMTTVDQKTGQTVQLKKLIVKAPGYFLQGGGLTARAPQQVAAPAQFAPPAPLPPQGYAPQAQAPQFAPPPQQYAQQPQQQQFAPPAQQAPQGFPPPQPYPTQQASQQFAPPPANGQQAAVPPWVSQAQPTGAPEAEAPKRGRRKQGE